MANAVKKRRTQGSAWYWRQTDSWYFTRPGTQQRVPLLDDVGKRIRGQHNRKEADLALARVKVARQWRPTPEPSTDGDVVVARICSDFIRHSEHRSANGTITSEYLEEVVRYLNVFSEYCGALPVSQLKRGHVEHWIESHDSWRSPVTRRNAIAIVQAAFNHAAEERDIRNPLKGLKKPPPRPRLHSLDGDEESAIYKPGFPIWVEPETVPALNRSLS